MKLKTLLVASAVAVTLTMTGCAHDNKQAGRKDRVVKLGKITVLGWTQAARLPDGSRLQYINVTNDSRCKPNVQCVWAGQADANFRYMPVNGAPYNFTMKIPQELTKRVGNYYMTIDSLEQIGPNASTPPAIVRFRPAN